MFFCIVKTPKYLRVNDKYIIGYKKKIKNIVDDAILIIFVENCQKYFEPNIIQQSLNKFKLNNVINIWRKITKLLKWLPTKLSN